MKNVLQASLLIIGFSFPFISFAELGPAWIVLEGGATFSTTQHKTYTAPMPNDAPPSFLYDDYKTYKRDDGYLIGLSAGYEFELDEWIEEWLPKARLGLGYEYIGKTKVHGQLHKYQEQAYYDYDYKTYSQAAWLIGQFDLPNCRKLTPFLDLGLGISFNHSSAYNEKPINDQVPVRASADFDSHTETDFAWRAGVGVNYQHNKTSPWKLGMVVRYSDLGEGETGDSKTYPTVESLTLPITNLELALQLGYYF